MVQVRDPLADGDGTNSKMALTYVTPEVTAFLLDSKQHTSPHHPVLTCPLPSVARGLGDAWQVNKKIRMQLLRQNWFTNKFEGSSEAARCEQEFGHFISRYHLRRVRRRLLVTSAALLLSAIEPLSSGSNIGVYLTLRSIIPIATCLLAALLCFGKATYRYWRFYVVTGSIIVYNSILWADATVDVSGWSPESQDYSTIMQCVWVLIIMQFCALGFALDFVQQLIVIVGQVCNLHASSRVIFTHLPPPTPFAGFAHLASAPRRRHRQYTSFAIGTSYLMSRYKVCGLPRHSMLFRHDVP